MNRFARTSLALAAALSLALPASAALEPSFAELVDKVALVPGDVRDSDMLAKVTEAVGHIKRMALPRAQQAVNEALQLDARNSYLHLLNGFVYHLQARQGDTQKTEMAIEGYQQALRLDPGNWIAQEFLGLAHVDLQQFDRAKAEFTNVLLLTPDSRTSMFGLMVTSYLTGDARTACMMADQFQKSPETLPRSFVRSSIAVYASCANFAQADRMRLTLARLDGDGPDVKRAERRLDQWKAFYSRQATAAATAQPATFSSVSPDGRPQVLAQAFTLPPMPRPTPAASQAAPAAAAGAVPAAAAPAATATVQAEPGGDGPRMLLVDVVLLSTQELASTSKGVNLLSALSLQLGSVAGNLAAYSRVNTWNLAGAAADPTATTAITRAVTIPALSYSLNIANANSAVNEVLARPTLAAIEGQPSEFFSGTNLSAGLVSTSTQGGTTVVPLDKKFGIKLAVTPVFLSRGRVQLKVEAQRTSLDATVNNPKAAYQIEIGETTANANVVMNLGDTLILSGLSEKSSNTTRDGVPGLQEVPVVQYLFSNKKTNDVRRSVLVLVTPRSPVQVSQDPGAASETMPGRMAALRERFGFGANVPPNVDAIMNQLQPNELFREFRQGDVAMERWDRSSSTVDRLKEALGFLYY
ncbi:secretion protein [Roseateles sp.]|uniref:secretion protein n=1 Tax=Roseateles sp. TaxID=1971397 RepID=UPI003BAB7A3D